MQYQFLRIVFFAFMSLFIWQLTACKKDSLIKTPGSALVFELDTLSFDTVFTDMGSATRKFKVYNPHNQRIIVSNIRIAGGTASDFNINIDGQNTHTADDVEILAGDSIYIYANVRIDPNNGDIIRTDSIIFETNGSEQKVILEAFGWNAVYIGYKDSLTRYTNTNMTLDPNTPYVFFGYVVFDTNSVLTIPAGTEIFMYGGPSSRPGQRATLFIGLNSSLKINVGGDLSNPVEFKTHRLEEDYQELPFQHGGIYLLPGSVDNEIHGCIIRNAVDGIIVDSLSNNHPTPKLDIRNSMIYNVDRSCILARTGSIYAENCILANSNQFNFIAILGGIYDFRHSTLVNFGVNPFVGRNEAIVSLRDFIVDADDNIIPSPVSPFYAHFTNCVIYGTKEEEVEVARATQVTWDYSFDYCFMKLDTFNQNLNNCIINQEPYFKDLDNYEYIPDTTASQLINAGLTPIGASPYLTPLPSSINRDAEGKSRDANPDIGAYEF